MEDTGLPSSTGRESTMPSMGDRMVALVSSSSARSTAAWAAATAARACAMRACATPSCVLRGLLPVDGHLEGAARVVQRLLGHELVLEQLLRPLEVAARERHVGPLGLDLVLLELGFGGGHVRLGAGQRGPRPRGGAPPGCPCRVRQHLADRHAVAHLDLDFLDDPVGLRLDLDLRDRLDAAGRDHRLRHVAALDGGEAGRVDVARRSAEAPPTPSRR